MEECLPGQDPEREFSASDDRVAARTLPPGCVIHDRPTARELEFLKEADRRALVDKAELLAHGFGDHKGMMGF